MWVYIISRLIEQNIYNVWHNNQSREDKGHDQHHTWHNADNKDNLPKFEGGSPLQVPWRHPDWWGNNARNTCKNCSNNRSTKVSLEAFGVTKRLLLTQKLNSYGHWMRGTKPQCRHLDTDPGPGLRCLCRLLGISYRDHIINEEVSERITNVTDPFKNLLSIVKTKKHRW